MDWLRVKGSTRVNSLQCTWSLSKCGAAEPCTVKSCVMLCRQSGESRIYSLIGRESMQRLGLWSPPRASFRKQPRSPARWPKAASRPPTLQGRLTCCRAPAEVTGVGGRREASFFSWQVENVAAESLLWIFICLSCPQRLRLSIGENDASMCWAYASCAKHTGLQNSVWATSTEIKGTWVGCGRSHVHVFVLLFLSLVLYLSPLIVNLFSPGRLQWRAAVDGRSSRMNAWHVCATRGANMYHDRSM